MSKVKNMSASFDPVKINKSDDYEIEFVIQIASNKTYLTIRAEVEGKLAIRFSSKE